MDYIESRYGINISEDEFLGTDIYAYFVCKSRGKNYVDNYYVHDKSKF